MNKEKDLKGESLVRFNKSYLDDFVVENYHLVVCIVATRIVVDCMRTCVPSLGLAAAYLFDVPVQQISQMDKSLKNGHEHCAARIRSF